MSGAITWVVGMDTLTNGAEQYLARLQTAVAALGDYFASRIQTDMRQNAPWEDRTGNARSGLFSISERMAVDVVRIWLSHGHTVDYGKWLELANAGKYAIIVPTFQQYMPEIEQALQRLVEG